MTKTAFNHPSANECKLKKNKGLLFSLLNFRLTDYLSNYAEK